MKRRIEINTGSKPPAWADRLLEWCCAPHLLEEVQGDLHERFHKRAKQVGEGPARRQFVWEALGFLRPFALKRKTNPYPVPLFTDMLKNYFTVALRTLLRRKAFSAIHVAGLAMGLACCMLIFLYTKDEVSYDRFHEKKDQIFRVTVQNDGKDGTSKHALTSMVVGPAFKQEIPEVETFVRLQENTWTLRRGKEVYTQDGTFVDADFFSVFSLPLLAGNPATVLTDLHAVVLTEETAQKYFGTTDAVGKTVELEVNGAFEPFVVTGIAKNPPQNSTLKFGMLQPYKYTEKLWPDTEWVNFYLNTFLVLTPGADLQGVAAKMNRVFSDRAKSQMQQLGQQYNMKNQFRLGVQPLLQIHLDTEYGGTMNGLKDGSKPIYSYLLTGIALFILLIACINFVNLTVAQSVKRAKEIGIRKVVGGRRSQLIGQFMGESFLLSLLAFSMALGLAELALPWFNELANKRLALSYLLDAQLVTGYLGLFLLTGLAAGFYPALVLSGFDPVQTLYKRTKLSSKNYLVKSLVVVQFTLAIFLIISTLVVYAQFDYLVNKDLGYKDENLVVVQLDRRSDPQQVKAFKNELSRESAIQLVGTKNRGNNYTVGKADGKDIEFAIDWIDENYLPALQIPVVKGRNFLENFPADREQSVLINETFVRERGWKDPIGRTIFNVNGNQKALTVVGVVKDHHFTSLKENISPQLFLMGAGDLYVKIRPDNLPHTLRIIGKTFRELVPHRPFQYEFMDERNRRRYEAEAKWKQIITFGAVLTVFISCIGLFGLTILSAERRIKEIGIRKVLGASVGQIIGLLTTHFLQLVGVAFVLAIPAAWYATGQWLKDFPYRIEIGGWTFAAAGVLVLGVALFTISFQSIKTALINPANSLRSE